MKIYPGVSIFISIQWEADNFGLIFFLDIGVGQAVETFVWVLEDHREEYKNPWDSLDW